MCKIFPPVGEATPNTLNGAGNQQPLSLAVEMERIARFFGPVGGGTPAAASSTPGQAGFDPAKVRRFLGQ